MVSVAGTQHRHESASVAKPARAPTDDTASPGNSGQSVGHLAKALLAAKADGEDQAPNAMGKAAASIARMTFEQRAALLQPPAPEPDPTTDPADGTETPPVDATETPPPDPTSEAAATIPAQILADADEASQGA